MHRERVLLLKDCYVYINVSELIMVTGLVVKKSITYQHFNSRNVQGWHNIPHKHVISDNPVCILNIHKAS